MELHLASIYEAIGDEIGEAVALIHGRRRVSWAEFEERSSRLSAAFGQMGLRPGSVVAIDLYNCPEFLEVFFAAIKAGYVPTMVNYRYRSGELVYLLNDANAEVVVASAELAPSIRAISADLPSLRETIVVGEQYEDIVASHDPAARLTRRGTGSMLSYTGGTTGLPKGVVYDMPRLAERALNTRWLCAEVDADAAVLETVRELETGGALPVFCPASPLMHSTAFTFAALPALAAGGSIATLETHRYDPDALLEACEAYGVTVTAVVGDAFARPLVSSLDRRAASGQTRGAHSLRAMCSAGVAFSADTKRRLLEHLPGLTILDACGATEGAHYGTSIIRAGDEPSTATFELAEGTIIVDGLRRRLPDGEVGYISGLRVTTGYHNHPQETAGAFYVDDAGEWRVTPGDLGRIEADGRLTLLGRGSSVINTGGEKVHPEEVESVIKTLAGVVDAVVWSVPDERLGSVVGAVIEPAPGAVITRDTVYDHVRNVVAGYKAPTHVVLVDEIPRHVNGKLDVERVCALLDD